MNKAQLIDKLSTRTQLTKVQAEAVLDATLEIIQKTLAKGDEVKLVGFGTFSVQKRKGRTARNPKTGTPVEIPVCQVPKFRPGKDFKSRLN